MISYNFQLFIFYANSENNEKVLLPVTPAKAGVYKPSRKLDSDFYPPLADLPE
jgi:hypothetical protein